MATTLQTAYRRLVKTKKAVCEGKKKVADFNKAAAAYKRAKVAKVSGVSVGKATKGGKTKAQALKEAQKIINRVKKSKCTVPGKKTSKKSTAKKSRTAKSSGPKKTLTLKGRGRFSLTGNKSGYTSKAAANKAVNTVKKSGRLVEVRRSGGRYYVYNGRKRKGVTLRTGQRLSGARKRRA